MHASAVQRLQSDLISRGALAPVSHGGRVYPPVHPWLTPKPFLDRLRRSLLLCSSWPWLRLLKLGTQASLQQGHSKCEGGQPVRGLTVRGDKLPFVLQTYHSP